MEALGIENLRGKVVKLEAQEKAAVRVQRQPSGKPGRSSAVDDSIPSCPGEVSLLFYPGLQLIG